MPNRDTDLYVRKVIEKGAPGVPFVVGEFMRQRSTIRSSGPYQRLWSALPPILQEHVPAPRRTSGNMAALAYILGMMGPEAREAVPCLMRGADDKSKEVRYYSIWALGQIGIHESRAILSAHLTDDETRVREAAETALRNLAFLEKKGN